MGHQSVIAFSTIRKLPMALKIWASQVAEWQRICLSVQETWVESLIWEDPLEKETQPTIVRFPGKSHEQRSLAGYNSWSHKELDTTEQVSRHTHTNTHTHTHTHTEKIASTTGRFRSMSKCCNQETFVINKLLILRIWQQKNRHLQVWLADRNWIIISRGWTIWEMF